MATRRAVASTSEKATPDKEEKSITSPVVPTHVIVKLLGFSFAMIVVPIGSYFLTVHSVFNGNSSLAGGMAALLANVVLISYVVVAMKEDQGEQSEKPETKKTQ
ncbi:Vacuolar ATPase assembly integral membrane protein vma21 [Escovopsis weberi]|uniref:Vacuolar ATPase assembly integral membrane protein vma21 n=1 Tax=Escovopsis weberi TaxID=150374 RepID=A0A0M8N107_ESCWE|nr:Vacuolar ATPase assembly integral membrane protein vma21 [Escovopsis weberi]